MRTGEEVREEAREIFYAHCSPPLPEGVEERMEAVLAEAAQALAE